jgi:two-component system, NarL family, response regulator LiaR
MAKIRILLADDHALVREGTRELLERESDMVVVAEASDGEEAVKLVAQEQPDVAIIDISMPKLNGIEVTQQIKDSGSRTAVLVLTAYDNDQYVFAVLEAGAAGYLLKDVPIGELVRAIRDVHAGESVLHPVIARKVINRYAWHLGEHVDTGNVDLLSEREFDVLRLVATGMKNHEIATALVISARTVQVHLTSVFTKLHVTSRTEAVLHALRQGWLTLEDTTRPGSSQD